ncbi:hypothetical protein OEZ60_07355 [Defluviimonas sp. WL0024]|uniref:Uncharacterized protein n=1 Tax=Albidovulum salinarum TaxID=2984153 RepID=A0ABT2X1L3_9RHOB|nr:hypothetical protein [Defluviimonas sp. WL0024]MCU9847821.1 hypothetical protein [Defluviimonas sp. WL0024]
MRKFLNALRASAALALLAAVPAKAESWLCIDEENLGLERADQGWKTSRPAPEKWMVTLEDGTYRLSSFSLEQIKRTDEAARDMDLSYICYSPDGSNLIIVCEGGLGGRFEFAPEKLRFVSFSGHVFYLGGFDDGPGAPGPHFSLGTCAAL